MVDKCLNACPVYLQVNRNVTNSVIASVEVTSLALCRSLDVGEAPIRLTTSTLTVSSSRHDPADLGNLSTGTGFGFDAEVTFPPDFHVDSSTSVLLWVNNSFAIYIYFKITWLYPNCSHFIYIFTLQCTRKSYLNIFFFCLVCLRKATCRCPAPCMAKM